LVYGLGRSSPASLEVIFADEMDSLSEELHAYLNPQTGELITISSEERQTAEAAADIESYQTCN